MFWCVLCFSLPLKSTFLATKNVSPTVFDLGGWNRYHFVGNWIPYTNTYHFFNIRSFSSKNRQHKQKICKKCEFFWEKKIDLLFKFLFFRYLKNQFVTLCFYSGKKYLNKNDWKFDFGMGTVLVIFSFFWTDNDLVCALPPLTGMSPILWCHNYSHTFSHNSKTTRSISVKLREMLQTIWHSQIYNKHNNKILLF